MFIQGVWKILTDSKVKVFLTLNVIAKDKINEPPPGYCVRIEVYTLLGKRNSLSSIIL